MYVLYFGLKIPNLFDKLYQARSAPFWGRALSCLLGLPWNMQLSTSL